MASSPIQLIPLADPLSLVREDMVSKELIQFFVDALGAVCNPPMPPSLVRDTALICALLQSNAVFDSFYRDHVDRVLRDKYFYWKDEINAGRYNPMQGGALLHSFYDLMKGEGFQALQGIVFTDNAPNFQEIVGNRLLFKDSTGVSHGEFTHSLQWLTFCILKKHGGSGYISQEWKFTNKIADIYAELPKFRVYPVIPDNESSSNGSASLSANTTPQGTLAEKRMWAGEKSFSGKMSRGSTFKTAWDFCVDMFSTTDRLFLPMNDVKEKTLSTLYTESYRCPANLMKEIETRNLMGTFIGWWWINRIYKYSRKNPKPGQPWEQARIYRQIVNDSQGQKGKVGTKKSGWWQAPPSKHGENLENGKEEQPIIPGSEDY